MFWFTKSRNISTDDEDLIRRTLDGEAEAYGQLYLKYVERIYRFIYFKTPSVQVTEDLTQTTFTKAFEKLKSYRSGSFQAWLYTIAYNIVRDYWRQQGRRGTNKIELESVQVADHTDLEEELDTKWTVERLKQQIATLTSPYREVVELRYLSDLSNSEVAQVLKKTEGWVRVTSHRGIRMLRENIEGRS